MPFRHLVCILLVACVVAPASSAHAATSVPLWRPPVDGPVVRRFDPPASRYGAGHLGVDYRAAPGSPVLAAGPGVVAFAGVVGGAVHVVVAHVGGLRTSYSFLRAASVHRGQTVARGAVVGVAGGTGDNHDGSVLHFGLRVGDRYVDPLLLFRPPDLTKVVHLAPTRDPVVDTVAGERRGVLAGLGHAIGAVAHAGVRTIVAVARLDAAALARIDAFIAAGPSRLRDLAAFIDELSIVPTPQDALRVAHRLYEWAQSLRTCDHHAPAADGTGGSGNHLMVVAGINSSTGDDGASLALPVDKLGYATEDVTYFSYRDDAGAYGRADTHEPIERAARQLRDQLRTRQRAQPGTRVDLIAHSQGGVVVLAFLLLYYHADDKTLPPLNTVVTLSSPLHGAPAAALAPLIASTAAGWRVLELVGVGHGSVLDLGERSELVAAIDALRLPSQIELTTIGAAADYVVPAWSAHLDGSASVDVDPVSAAAHSAIYRDPHALRAVRAALEHRAMPCMSLGEALDAAVLPTAITRVEHLGAVGAIGSRVPS